MVFNRPAEPVKVVVSDRVLRRNVGGNSRYANALIKGLRSSRVQLTVAGPRRFNSPILRAASYIVYENTGIRRKAKSICADAAFFPADSGPILPSKIPIVTTVHGVAAMHVTGIRSPLQERIWSARVSRAIGCSAAVITVSQSSANDLMSYFGVDASRIHVIPHGIDHDQFNTRPTDLPESLGNLPERFILFLGNIEPRKNITAISRAISSAEFAHDDVHLVVAGNSAWASSEILDELRSNPRVQYRGFENECNLLPLLQRAQAFVFPSLYEGFGFPVLEAMASGCPVICSSNGSLAEVVGDAAILLASVSPQAIARELNLLLSDKSKQNDLRKRGVARAAQFTWERSISAHEELFLSLRGK